MTARVLVVDDSAVVRGMLSKIISADPELELAGTASNGAIGLEKAAKLKPDIIVLDIEMPVMGGIEALTRLRQTHPTTPIVMFSTLTARGAEASFEALSLGASDYATKPTNAGSSGSATEQVRSDLMVKLKALLKIGTGVTERRPAGSPAADSEHRFVGSAPAARAGADRRTNKRVEALIIGSSTGGPSALEKVLGDIPQPLPVPIFITQHLPSNFTRALADRLDRFCCFPVVEADRGMEVEPGTCYLAPGHSHLGVTGTMGDVRIGLGDGPPVKSCKPSVDVMADSVQRVYGDRLVAAMLSGMGSDGADAYRRLADIGVEIIVQDEATSVVWGMPRAVHQSGAANHCLPLDQISGALVEAVRAGRPTMIAADSGRR